MTSCPKIERSSLGPSRELGGHGQQYSVKAGAQGGVSPGVRALSEAAGTMGPGPLPCSPFSKVSMRMTLGAME